MVKNVRVTDVIFGIYPEDLKVFPEKMNTGARVPHPVSLPMSRASVTGKV